MRKAEIVFIDHVAMWVRDLEATRAFYERYFGAVANSQYHNPTTGLRTYFLSFEGGCRLEIMSRAGYDAQPDAAALGLTHTAFTVGNRAAVDDLVERFRGDGVPVLNGPRVTGDGYYEAVVADPDGNQVEIVA